jgi:hypothetical protein
MNGRGQYMMHGDVSATQEYGGPGPIPIQPPQAPAQGSQFFCMPGFCCHKREPRPDESMDQPVHEYHEYASMPFHGAGTVDDVEKDRGASLGARLRSCMCLVCFITGVVALACYMKAESPVPLNIPAIGPVPAFTVDLWLYTAVVLSLIAVFCVCSSPSGEQQQPQGGCAQCFSCLFCIVVLAVVCWLLHTGALPLPGQESVVVGGPNATAVADAASCRLTLEGLDYASLATNATSMTEAQEAIKEGVAPTLGVDLADVDVQLSQGSVIADLTIRPFGNASVNDLQQQLAASSRDIQSAVAGSLSAKAEQFQGAVVGNISVSSLDLTPPHLGIAGAGAATGGHLGNHVANALGWAGGVAGHIHHHATKAVEHVKNSSATEWVLNKSQDALDHTSDWAANASQAALDATKHHAHRAANWSKDKISDAASDAGDWINNQTGLGDHIDAAKHHINGAAEWVDNQTGGAAGDALEAAGSTLHHHATSAANWTLNATKHHAAKATEWVTNNSQDVLDGAVDSVKHHSSQAADWVANNTPDSMEGALDTVKHHSSQAADWVANNTPDTLGGAMDAVQHHTGKAVEHLQNKSQDALNGAVDAAQHHASKAQDALAGAVDTVDQSASNAKDALGNSTLEAGQAAKARLAQLQDQVSDGMMEDEAAHMADSKQKGVWHAWGA